MKTLTTLLLYTLLTTTVSAAPSGHITKRSTAVEQVYQSIVSNLLNIVSIQETAEMEDAGLLDDLELADEEEHNVGMEDYNLFDDAQKENYDQLEDEVMAQDNKVESQYIGLLGGMLG